MATNDKEICDHLISLAQLDIDAFHAYTQAIDQMDISEVKDQLMQFRDDHKRHVKTLAPVISSLGGNPPEFSLDFKGFLIQGMTTLRSVMGGTEGALKAMKMNEELTNRTYDRALQWDLSSHIRIMIKNNREDEIRHLQYISQCIEARIWEKKMAA